MPISIDVLANDQDTDGLIVPGSLAIVTSPAWGTVVVTTQITYNPAPNFNGQDSFMYRVCDNNNSCGTATVTVTVLPQDDFPLAAADAYTTPEDTPLVVAASGVLANDINVDPTDILEAQVLSDPSNGTLNLNADGSFG